jgi:integrase
MGCTITTTNGGRLAYRIRAKALPKYDVQEGTDLPDTPANREKLQKRAAVIADEIVGGSFDADRYLKWFPEGSLAAVILGRKRTEKAKPVPSFRDYVENVWLPRKVPPVVRAWCRRDYTKHLKNHILPAFGDMALDAITAPALEAFRTDLLKKGLKLKTCRNVMDGTLRALLRDARTVDKLIREEVFADLPPKWWPRRPKNKPDPFDANERDALLTYFREKRAFYYALVLTRSARGCALAS